MKATTKYNLKLLPDKPIISYDELLKIATHRTIVTWAGTKKKPGHITPLSAGTRLINQTFAKSQIVAYLSQLGSKRGRPKGSLNKKVKA